MRRSVRLPLVLVAALCLFCSSLDAALTLRPLVASIAVSETVALITSGPVQSWTSSNMSVATVSSVGVVTGLAPGQATITAKYHGTTASMTVTVTGSVPPPVVETLPVVETYGPSVDIVCPVGAVPVLPGATTIHQAVAANPGATIFCLGVGTFSITGAITPKSGDTFVCEFGAIIDGAAWLTTDPNQGAWRAHNQDIDDVTVRNCVIQHMPQRGIHYLGGTDRWTVEHNDIHHNAMGINIGSGVGHATRYNRIHDNASGGYLSYLSASPLIEHNEISYNGSLQKVVAATHAVFSYNFVHHNVADGIWFDTENTDTTIEGNTVEDNGRFGTHIEISGSDATAITVHTNVVRRSGDTGIMIVDSKRVDVSGNTLEDNFRAIQLYLKCAQVGLGHLDGYDLKNNNVHDNAIRVGSRSGSWANTLGWPSSDAKCDAAFVAPYLSNAKNNVYQGNAYTVPNVAGKYWMWGQGVFESFAEWQGIPQDATGSVH